VSARWMSVALVAVFACAHGQPAPNPAELSSARKGMVWYRVPGEFSVLMPPKVKSEEKTANVANRQVRVHLAEAEPAGAPESYQVSFTELPSEVLQKALPQDILRGVQQATIQKLGGQLIDSKEIVAHDMPGRQFLAHKAGEGDVAARVLVGKDGVFTLIGTYPSGPTPPTVLRFLESFTPAGSVSSATLDTGPASTSQAAEKSRVDSSQ
jgi:hypothetical protein